MRSDPRSRARSVLRAAATISCLVLPSCRSTGDAAAEPDAPDPAAMQNEMALFGELQSIDQALAPIREQAMSDPKLKAREQALVAQVQAAIEAAEPGLVGAEARFDSLRTEYEAAGQAGDSTRVQAIGVQLQSLQSSLKQVQGQVLEQEEIAEAVEGFRQDLFAHMRTLDPRADSLLDLAEDITQRLEAAAAARETGG